MSDAELRELAREILARKEFARWREEPGAIYDWLVWLSDQLRALSDWVWDYAPDWLSDLFSWLAPRGESEWMEPFSTIVAALSFVLVVALAVALGRAWRARELLGGPAPARPAPRLGGDLRGQADALAGDGQFLEAAHAVQLAALQLLIAGRWLELDRFEPNRTLRQRLNGSALPERERSEFVSLIGQLEARWFGDRVEGRVLFDGWCALHERLAALGDAR